MSGNAPGGRIFAGVSEEGIEIAMRGREHVLLGLEKGAKFALRQRRPIMHNATRNQGASTVSELYQSFENASMQCKKEHPDVDVDEMHRRYKRMVF